MEIDGRAEVSAVASKAEDAGKISTSAAAEPVDSRTGKHLLEGTNYWVLNKQIPSVLVSLRF